MSARILRRYAASCEDGLGGWGDVALVTTEGNWLVVATRGRPGNRETDGMGVVEGEEDKGGKTEMG